VNELRPGLEMVAGLFRGRMLENGRHDVIHFGQCSRAAALAAVGDTAAYSNSVMKSRAGGALSSQGPCSGND
jgi:hypothetical protein